MRLHILSDLHLEVRSLPAADHPDTVDAEVTILAGDIGMALSGIEWALTINRPVLYVFGNHEGWDSRSAWERRPLTELLAAARARTAGTQVHVLENDALDLMGVRFLGCTLWTDFAVFPEREPADLMARLAEDMSDYRKIVVRDGPERTRPLRPADTLTWHEDSRDFLAGHLYTPTAGKTVVVTHHAPSARSLLYGEAMVNIDAAYASHVDDLVARADLWVQGHTHVPADYAVGPWGRVVSNPRGYVGMGEVVDFDPRWVVEV